jgi:heme/copper-type cytochrome/quinol oxidase subunit 2
LRFLLQFSPVWLFFYPGLVLMVAGVGAMAWLLPQQRSAAGIAFGVNTLVFAAASIVCGFQAIVFYVFAKTYAINAGLLPDDNLVARIRSTLRLEVGLVAGLICVIIGVALATYAVGIWEERSFGPLNPERSLRVVIPSATLLIIGVQIMFSSSLLSIFHLETRTTGARTRSTDKA